MADEHPSHPMSPAVEAATVAKLEAEAESFLAAARKARAEAAIAETEAETKAIARDVVVRNEAIELAKDAYHQRYHFASAVDSANVKACMAKLTEWHRRDPECDIEVVFTSPGGSVVDGMALFDFITELRKTHKVTTSTLGIAASMAGILLQAGDVRVMGKESWLLIHEASFGAGGKIGEVEDTVEWVKKVCDRILDIFEQRAHVKKAFIKRNWSRRDWWISSDEALKHGFVDEVR